MDNPKDKTKNKRLIWQKPKQIKRYWIYAIAFHLLLIFVIMMIVIDSYRSHPHPQLVDATVISSIPTTQHVKPASHQVQHVQQHTKPIQKANLLPSYHQTALQKQQLHLQHQLLSKQLSAEQQQLHAASKAYQQQQMARMRLIDQYEQRIISHIEANWQIPTHINHHLYCIVALTLAADGEILASHLIKSSGNPLLDSSAMDAVKQSSPLPVPTKPALFNLFKQLRLTLRPEKIVHQH